MTEPTMSRVHEGAPHGPVTDLNEFGARVKALRSAQNLTQAELAATAGIDRKTISRIENSHYAPTLTNVFAIAEALGLPARDLL